MLNSIGISNKSAYNTQETIELRYDPNDTVLSCRYLERGLAFQTDGLYSCCLATVLSPKLFGVDEIESGKIDHLSIVEKRKDIFLRLNSNDVSISCHCCGEVYQKKFKDVHLDRLGGCLLNIQHYTVCNFSCSYCPYAKADELLPPQYSEQKIIDILKCFGDKEKIITGSWIQISGGEPTMLRNLEALISGIIDMDFGDICIFTNSFKHSDIIENYLKSNSVFLSTSVDAGIPSTYKKMRGKEMQVVFDTLVKYRMTGTTRMQIKYIITDENRSEDDLFSFVLLVLVLKPNLVHIIPEFPYGDKQIPRDSALFGAKLLYSLRKYGDFNITLQADGISADPKFTKFSVEMHEEYDRLCTETELTDEYHILNWTNEKEHAVQTGGYVNHLTKSLSTYVEKNSNRNKKIALWGYGTYGQLFCYDNDIVEKNITVIIDADKHKQGIRPLLNKSIIVEPPEYLVNNNVDAIIIASSNYRIEILDYIKKNIKHEVEIIK